jgi:rhomboid protease GluP
VIGLLLVLIVALGVAYRITTAEERARFYRIVAGVVGQLRAAEARRQEALKPFRESLRTRTRRPILAPAIVTASVAVFLAAAGNSGPVGDAETLLAWGASYAPRTTNGEWWRLVSSIFLHAGLVHLIVCMAGLAQVGFLVERMTGRAAFAAVYIGAGVLASIATLSEYPLAVHAGASGAVFGVYSLFLVARIVARCRSDGIEIPVSALQPLLPAAAIFVLYTLGSGPAGRTAALAGLMAGSAGGVALTLGAGERGPSIPRAAATLAGALAIAVVAGVPLRGVTDVRPELQRLVAIEDETSKTYWAAVERFKRRRIAAGELAEMIDRKIRPQLETARARLSAVTGVLPEHQPLVAAAERYHLLRDESWRLRAEGLRGTNMLLLRRAELAERQSLEALETVKPAPPPASPSDPQ